MARWIPDDNGVFDRRPFYEAGELDADCEAVVEALLQQRYGAVRYPIDTDDLHILIEQEGADLDAYADLSAHGFGAEGLTEFFPDRPPRVSISNILATDPRRTNRYRTTLTHEFGHVRYHGPLYMEAFRTGRLTDHRNAHSRTLHLREDPMEQAGIDWMEWQAGYVCGSVLMPATAVRRFVKDRLLTSPSDQRIHASSGRGRKMIVAVRKAFAVSFAAAQVRLLQLGWLSET